MERIVTPESQAAAPQAAESVCVLEPTLPAHLKDSAPAIDPDWNAKALEALAKQLTETNDFYHPLSTLRENCATFGASEPHSSSCSER